MLRMERHSTESKSLRIQNRPKLFGTANLSVVCCFLVSSAFSGPRTTPSPQGLEELATVSSLLRASHEQVAPTDPSFRETGRGLLSVRLVPSEAILRGAGASQQFAVAGEFADGVERDLTSETRFSISGPGLADVTDSGWVRAVTDGTTALNAEISGRVISAEIRIEAARRKRPFGFKREMGGVLTKLGCNSSDCHGGVKGRGGFKLSVDALYPGEDYDWIVKGGGYQVLTDEVAGERIPRISVQEPDQSLLLLKSAGVIPHGGGQLLDVDSPEYTMVLAWVRHGAPYQEEGSEDFQIERLEVFPAEGVLNPDGERQLLVTAHLANGEREDFTHQVRYVSTNPEVVEVTPEGLVFAAGPGEVSVIVRAAGQAASVRIGVVEEAIFDYPEVASWNFIDDYVFAKLRKFHVLPSELSSDEEFLRRACLDVTGTLPPPERVREFLASRDPQKRRKLIEILLNTPEYTDYWTFRVADILRVGSGVTAPDTDGYWEWIRDSIALNKPYDELLRERLAAQGYDGPSRHYLLYGKVPPVETLVAEQMRVLLGRRFDCAQCHNHPYETWSQDQFWGLASFFGGMKATTWEGPNQAIYDDSEGQEVDYGVLDETSKILHPRTGKEISPTFLDGRILPDGSTDPRMVLGKWITSHPYFAEAGVNRIWGYLFGRGIVDPVDDFRLTAPPTHPRLLEALAADFRERGYDLKHLIRLIVSSRTYQLSSIPNSTNQNDKINYSHALPRPLDAEVLLDAISEVTGVPERFVSSAGGRAPQGARSMNLRNPRNWPSRFLEIHGRTVRQDLPERDGSPTLAQALHRLVGPTYTEKLSPTGGRWDQLLKKNLSDREIVEELYLAALSRLPSEEEQTGLERLIAGQSTRKQGFENLLWALIGSREFAHNH